MRTAHGGFHTRVSLLALTSRHCQYIAYPFIQSNAWRNAIGLIFEFHGQSGFRRFERQCLEDAIQRYPCFVMATGGSLVSEAGTFERLLSGCFTVWLKASHAMSDLKRILSKREPLYAKADIQIDTAGKSIAESLEMLIRSLRDTPVREALTSTVVPRIQSAARCNGISQRLLASTRSGRFDLAL